jgi:subfamily B ATP-binding cassette protein MsbA
MRIWRYALEYKGAMVLTVVFNLLFVVFNLLSLLLFVPFLKLIFTENLEAVAPPNGAMGFGEYWGTWYNFKMFEYIQMHGKVGALSFICVSILIAFFLKNLFRYLALFSVSTIRTGVIYSLRKEMYNKILRLRIGFFSDEKKGDVMSRAMNDVMEVQWSILQSIEMIFREPIAIILTLVLLFYYSWELTLFSLIFLPVSAFVISRIGKSLRRTSSRAQGLLGELGSRLEETLGGLRVIKAFNSEKAMAESFEKKNSQYRINERRALRKRDLASPVNEFMGSIVIISIVWFGGNMILSNNGGRLDGTTFIFYVVTFSQLLRPIQGISNAISSINKGKASMDRIKAILDSDEEITELDAPKLTPHLKEKISFHDVEFSYQDEKILHGISFEIKKGDTIALVGESGGGKSTILNLIPRFYDIQKGSIQWDGTDIKDMSLKNLRAKMGIVTQDAVLFNDTVANNILFGKKASQNEIETAAKIANAHDFIMSLPNGYETNVGDGGGKLSGGQKQRISIARAVLSNPEVLLLDEATSALDTESEKLVQDALDKLMQNRTSIVIAHRLSTIRNADLILVIEKGQIVEFGKHDELIAQSGSYARLSQLQNL